MAIKRFEYHARDYEFPDRLNPYWKNQELPSEEVHFDFYEKIPQIESVAIRIFRECVSPCKELGSDDTLYQIQKANVILASSEVELTVGLHLFPVLRVNREKLPEVTFHIRNGDRSITPLYLPSYITSRLSKFFNEGKPTLEFNSIDFVNFLTEDIHEYDLIDRETTENIIPGDTVVLISKENRRFHAAIYLGEGMYLWFCKKVCLMVSSYEGMICNEKPARVQVRQAKQTALEALV